MTNEAPKSQPDFKEILLAKHGEDDTICVSMLKNSGVEERFVGGVEAAARMIERNYEREDIQAFWTNLQTLRKGADARRKEQIEKYTNLTVDIDRKWKWIHEDGVFCK